MSTLRRPAGWVSAAALGGRAVVSACARPDGAAARPSTRRAAKRGEATPRATHAASPTAIVVNNAIVLVDAVNQGRRAGLGKQPAIVRAAHQRLRPILMTTLTTVLGLVPMAISFGEGAELRAPLAITVLFGLSAATGLTLLVIPAVYKLVPSRIETEVPAAEPAPAAPPLAEPA